MTQWKLVKMTNGRYGVWLRDGHALLGTVRRGPLGAGWLAFDHLGRELGHVHTRRAAAQMVFDDGVPLAGS